MNYTTQWFRGRRSSHDVCQTTLELLRCWRPCLDHAVTMCHCHLQRCPPARSARCRRTLTTRRYSAASSCRCGQPSPTQSECDAGATSARRLGRPRNVGAGRHRAPADRRWAHAQRSPGMAYDEAGTRWGDRHCRQTPHATRGPSPPTEDHRRWRWKPLRLPPQYDTQPRQHDHRLILIHQEPGHHK